MDLTISLTDVARVFISALGIGFLAMLCLWPINDKPTSRGQFLMWIVLSVFLVSGIFGKITFNIVP